MGVQPLWFSSLLAYQLISLVALLVFTATCSLLISTAPAVFAVNDILHFVELMNLFTYQVNSLICLVVHYLLQLSRFFQFINLYSFSSFCSFYSSCSPCRFTAFSIVSRVVSHEQLHVGLHFFLEKNIRKQPKRNDSARCV